MMPKVKNVHGNTLDRLGEAIVAAALRGLQGEAP